jgi:hypothetical protein
VKWRGIISFAVAAIVVHFAWRALHPSDEAVVRKQLQSLAKTASFSPKDGLITKAAGIDKLIGYFSTNVAVDINVPGLRERLLAGRDELQQAALAARGSGKTISVSFPDVTVIVNADHESAVADATLQARVSGESDNFVQEVKFHFHKTNGDWLIDKVETVKTLQ